MNKTILNIIGFVNYQSWKFENYFNFFFSRNSRCGLAFLLQEQGGGIKKNLSDNWEVFLSDTGIEPATRRLRVCCSTSWANRPFLFYQRLLRWCLRLYMLWKKMSTAVLKNLKKSLKKTCFCLGVGVCPLCFFVNIKKARREPGFRCVWHDSNVQPADSKSDALSGWATNAHKKFMEFPINKKNWLARNQFF